jgi:hypothetical protein
MCLLCATSAALTAAAATTTATAIGTLGFDATRLLIARLDALKGWFQRHVSRRGLRLRGSSLKCGIRAEGD